MGKLKNVELKNEVDWEEFFRELREQEKRRVEMLEKQIKMGCSKCSQWDSYWGCTKCENL